MNKRNAIIVVIVVFAIVYGVFLRGSRTPTNSDMNGPSQEQGQEYATTTISTTVTIPVKKTTSIISAPKMTSVTILKDGSYLVSYTDRGFVPSSLEIKTGKSVHFVNNSNKAMSLTTTDPDNQVYGEFNQSKTVGKGGIYDFTFLQPGLWNYVNRNNQGDKGVVVVK